MLLSTVFAKSETPEWRKMSAFVRNAAVKERTAMKASGQSYNRAITTFVCVSGDKGDEILADNGCTIYDHKDDIYIAVVPFNRLMELASRVEVRRIETSPSCRTAMDTTRTVVCATPVHEGTNLQQAYTGKGVILGIEDVGFDLTHPTFLNTEGTECRIRRFWDMVTTDTVGSTMPVGREYTSVEAIAEKQRSFDGLIQTHGTHTLGIAAGTGYGTAYRGMAYESDICAVSNAVDDDIDLIDPNDVYKYTVATDMLGFKYIFDYAESEEKPCVVSFSEGYSYGEDGDDSLCCEYVKKLVGPGRILVAAAGNESIYPSYVSKPVGVEQAGTTLYGAYKNSSFFAESDRPFSLRFVNYSDTNGDQVIDSKDEFVVQSDSCKTDENVTFNFLTVTGDTLFVIDILRYPSRFAAGDTVYSVTLNSKNELSSYKIAVAAEGVDAEVSLRSSYSILFLNKNIMGDSFQDAEKSHNILAPGAFRDVVTVGATIHRKGFINWQGVYVDGTQSGDNNGTLAYYSSVGPGIDGSIKPDITAPGSNVISAYSNFYFNENASEWDSAHCIGFTNYEGQAYPWVANLGTSMACPVVAGAIALWLEANPALSPDDIKDIFSRTARQPEESLEYPNNKYGYGEINVYKGLIYALGMSDIKELSAEPLYGVAVRMQTEGLMTLDFNTMPERQFCVSVYSVSGVKVFSCKVKPSGDACFSIKLPPMSSGVYAVQVTSPEKGCTGSTLIRI